MGRIVDYLNRRRAERERERNLTPAQAAGELMAESCWTFDDEDAEERARVRAKMRAMIAASSPPDDRDGTP